MASESDGCALGQLAKHKPKLEQSDVGRAYLAEVEAYLVAAAGGGAAAGTQTCLSITLIYCPCLTTPCSCCTRRIKARRHTRRGAETRCAFVGGTCCARCTSTRSSSGPCRRPRSVLRRWWMRPEKV